MLPERVLKDLLRPTPLAPHLVKSAWPSLSTEAKLQLIDSAQLGGHTPSYILKLAAQDLHPIVRYWAIRLTELPDPDSPHPWDSEDELNVAKLVQSDTDPLVAAVLRKQETGPGLQPSLAEGSHLARLIAIRTTDYLSFHSFVEFIKSSVDANEVSHEELAECLHEYADSQSFSRILADEASEDGYDNFLSTKAMEELWDLARRVKPHLQISIAKFAPLRVERTNVPLEKLASLPAFAIEIVLHRSQDPAAIALREHILSNAEQFDQKTVETAKFLAEFDERKAQHSETDQRDYAIGHSTTDQEKTLRLVEALRAEVADLREQISQLRDAAKLPLAQDTFQQGGRKWRLFG